MEVIQRYIGELVSSHTPVELSGVQKQSASIPEDQGEGTL